METSSSVKVPYITLLPPQKKKLAELWPTNS